MVKITLVVIWCALMLLAPNTSQSTDIKEFLDDTGMPIVILYHEKTGVPLIDPYVTRQLFKEGKLILAFAEESWTFDRKHIYGSISIPQGSDMELPRDDIVIAFYCG